jgi:hypothetical protein
MAQLGAVNQANISILISNCTLVDAPMKDIISERIAADDFGAVHRDEPLRI